MKTLLALLDLQDALLVAGAALVIGGMTAIYRPAGALTAGALAFGFALLIERARSAGKKEK